MANSSVNRINTTISAPDLTTINTALTTLLTTLNNYTQALTAEERAVMFSLQEENFVFAKEALAQGQLLNAGLPAPLQTVVTNMATDLSLWEQLNSLSIGNVAQLLLRVSDTQRLTAHEVYTGALALYKFIEAGAALGLEGYAAAFDVLKTRFAGQGNSGGSEPQPTP